jgi:hypothetical protein
MALESALNPAAWFRSVLEQLDAGADVRVVAARVVLESPMLLTLVQDHIVWELARAAIAADRDGRAEYPEIAASTGVDHAGARAARYAALFFCLTDPTFGRSATPTVTSSATAAASAAEASNAAAAKEERLPGLYL